ncbi:MAG TPA: extracellular solute-binding protein [Candidatus Binatia bacterium]|nr:extracellular solute-binding protein [Candidatus Binatia bacterium]
MKARFLLYFFPGILWILLVLPRATFSQNVEEILAQVNKLSPAERQKQLEAGAKKEGKLKFSSNENTDLIQKYQAGFAAKYPFLKVESSRESGAKGVEKILLEHRAGKLDTDVIGTPFETTGYLKREGVWARYFSPESQYYSSLFKDKDGYWTANHFNIAVIGHNTRLVKSEEAPKDYPDILHPKWKNEILIDMEPDRAVQGWLISWGEEKTRGYMRGLMRNGTTVRRGHNLQIQLLCSGETKIAVELYAYRVAQFKNEQKCPAGMSFPNPTPGAPGSQLGITKNAPHPYAAALFVDFVLAPEGSKILASTGRLPARRGVKALYEEVSHLEEKGVNLLIIPVEQADQLNLQAKKLIEDILIRRQF